jgi:hypothetical protein
LHPLFIFPPKARTKYNSHAKGKLPSSVCLILNKFLCYGLI